MTFTDVFKNFVTVTHLFQNKTENIQRPAFSNQHKFLHPPYQLSSRLHDNLDEKIYLLLSLDGS